MKTIKILIISLLLMINLFNIDVAAQCGEFLGNRYFTYLNDCYSNDWVLEFEDNFDGGQLDDDEWFVTFPYTNAMGEFAAVTADNLNFVSQSVNPINSASGVLQFISKPEPVPIPTWIWTAGGNQYTDVKSFSTGMIHSKKDIFGYGKYELRCRIPNGNGHWPAFWIFGTVSSTWKEIDFFEFNFSTIPARNDEILLNAHYNPINQTDTGKAACGTTYSNGTDYSLGFYTYTCIYSPTEIKWYLDQYLIRTMYKYTDLTGVGIPCSNMQINQVYLINAAFPPAGSSNLIINDNIGNELADVPDLMEIDYVRYWTQETTTTNPCNHDETISYGFGGYYSGDNIAFTGNAYAAANTGVVATNSIIMSPNFNTNGNEFSARINPFLCGPGYRMGSNGDGEDGGKDESAQINGFDNQDNELVEPISAFKVYPNPNNGQFNIDVETNGESTLVQVYDVMGKQVYSENGMSNKIIIDITDQPQGIYLVKITVGNQVFNEKIVYQ